MKRKVKVIDGNKIFLNAMKKAGIEVPKTKKEAMALLDDVKKEVRK